MPIHPDQVDTLEVLGAVAAGTGAGRDKQQWNQSEQHVRGVQDRQQVEEPDEQALVWQHAVGGHPHPVRDLSREKRHRQQHRHAKHLIQNRGTVIASSPAG